MLSSGIDFCSYFFFDAGAFAGSFPGVLQYSVAAFCEIPEALVDPGFDASAHMSARWLELLLGMTISSWVAAWAAP